MSQNRTSLYPKAITEPFVLLIITLLVTCLVACIVTIKIALDQPVQAAPGEYKKVGLVIEDLSQSPVESQNEIELSHNNERVRSR